LLPRRLYPEGRKGGSPFEDVTAPVSDMESFAH